MAKITMDGKYQTRDGRPVRVLCVDAECGQPVVAIVAGYILLQFESDGRFFRNGDYQSEFDLIPVPEKRRIKFWVNVYEPFRTSVIHEDKASADAYANPDRIACLEIDREFPVGEGL